MTAPSYASAAAGVASPTHRTDDGKTSLERQIEELSEPKPHSMTLVATLELLAPISESQDVYLVPRSYLSNWLVWAYHQKVAKTESQRVEAALRLAADQLGLDLPTLGASYVDPGPVDSSVLSKEGHPLLLKPDLEVLNCASRERSGTIPGALRRVRSLNETDEANAEAVNPEEGTTDYSGDKVVCCAVPMRFYEIIRTVHGVVCSDGFSVSFHPSTRESKFLIHHHQFVAAGGQGLGAVNGHHHTNGHHDGMNGSTHQNGVGLTSQPKPVEFRRRVIKKPAPKRKLFGTEDSNSPMSKLLKEQERIIGPRIIPTVEVFPVKLSYEIVDGKRRNSESGFVLVSRREPLYDSLKGLLEVAAPNVSSSCKRVWCKRDKGTSDGDGYEVVDLTTLDGKLVPKDGERKKSTKLLGNWARTFDDPDTVQEIKILLEVKKSTTRWPREGLELENRIKVGDFVDAQDDAGKWYEALVREVTEETVTVHYFGWASRWNSTIRRRKGGEIPGVSTRINPPAPLWTYSNRWRARLTEGSVVEVRDTSSRVDKPKWYKGVVKFVGPKGGRLYKMEGGASLELFEDTTIQTNGQKAMKPLLLLKKTQQIMVEVEEEKRSNPPIQIKIEQSDSETVDTFSSVQKPDPPFLRWISLFGEEICEAGTHMKIEKEGDLAVVTLRYEYDTNRKPVEVMKSFNNMYGQGFMKESLRGTPPAAGSVGMHNLGNSCFLNSIIQCLNHIEPLTQYFLKGEYMNDLNRKNPLGSGGRVANAYAALLKEIWSGKYSALAPRLLKQTVASFAPQFNNSYQHDSQEFCQFLMDGLHEDCNRVKNKPYVEDVEGFGMKDEEAAIETWRKHLLRHDSVIVDFCQGMHRSHLTCPTCGRESIKFDVFSTISLPLAIEKQNQAIDLQDCIDKFMEGEQLDELNAWYCPGCKKHVCALKMIALWSVPDILILHLKRFTFDHCAVSNDVVRSKIDETVKFPIDGLDIRRHVLGPIDEAAPPVYSLFGVSEHTGPTANSGHYTATVRNSKDGRWHRYNDAHVGETTGDATVTGGAYVLFYQRTKGSAKWAGMEKAMKERNVNPYGALDTDQDGFTQVKSKKKK